MEKISTQRAGRLFLNGALLAFAIPAVLSVLALCARWWWPLDLCTHFRAHFLAALLLGAVICLIVRRFKIVAVLGAFAALNLWFIAPLYFSPGTATASGGGVRLMTVNVCCANNQYASLLKLINEESPDVLVVLEVTPAWKRALAPLADMYPARRVIAIGEHCFGNAIFSKLPAEIQERDIGGAGVLSIVAKVQQVEGVAFWVVGTHPIPPIRAGGAEMRNRQLEALGKFIGELEGPVVLMGDFNTTSWSPHFRDVVRTSGLRDTRRGFGNQPTWPSELVAFGIAIDHVLASPTIGVERRVVGPDIGSDHRPVIVDLRLPANAR